MTDSRARRLARAYVALADAEDHLAKIRESCSQRIAGPSECWLGQLGFDRVGSCTLLKDASAEFIKAKWLDVIEYVIAEAEAKVSRARSEVAIISSEVNK